MYNWYPLPDFFFTAFGATPAASSSGGGLFGQANQAQTGGLFSTPSTNASFGAKPTGFGRHDCYVSLVNIVALQGEHVRTKVGQILSLKL